MTGGLYRADGGVRIVMHHENINCGGAKMSQSEGAYRVGLDFNPSGSEEVNVIKKMAADFIDLLSGIAQDRDHPGARCAAIAITDIEGAAMWAVKAVTKPRRGQ